MKTPNFFTGGILDIATKMGVTHAFFRFSGVFQQRRKRRQISRFLLDGVG